MSNFIDEVLKNHVEIYLNNTNHAFKFDLDGNTPYCSHNSKYDYMFVKNEVPYDDAQLLNNFINIYDETLNSKFPTK